MMDITVPKKPVKSALIMTDGEHLIYAFTKDSDGDHDQANSSEKEATDDEQKSQNNSDSEEEAKIQDKGSKDSRSRAAEKAMLEGIFVTEKAIKERENKEDIGSTDAKKDKPASSSTDDKPKMLKWSVSDGYVIDRGCSTCNMAWSSTGTIGCKCDHMDYQFYKDDIAKNTLEKFDFKKPSRVSWPEALEELPIPGLPAGGRLRERVRRGGR